MTLFFTSGRAVYRPRVNLLSQCAIVNSEFNRVASRLLYSRVVYSPPFRSVLDLKDKGIPSVGHHLLNDS
ncbi:hypothetical protein BD779DRAFT_243700 [Infundibulicybe gibba]|nr:hypothetical protein BD779DRAFT_243700 [Infundibulicybe gibba]